MAARFCSKGARGRLSIVSSLSGLVSKGCSAYHLLWPAARVGDSRRTKKGGGARDKPLSFHQAKKQNRSFKRNMDGPFLRKNKPFDGYNDPRLARRAVRLARRHSESTGFASRLERFHEQAEAFPNKPPLVVYTLVERGPIMLPDVEDWEREFLEYQQSLQAKSTAPLPPEAQALLQGLSMDEAFANSSAGRQGGGKKSKKKQAKAQQGTAAPVGAGDEAAPAGGEAGAAAATGDEEADSLAAASLAHAPAGDFTPLDPLMPPPGSEDFETDHTLWGGRQSEADKLGDTRTLDRRYDQRLVLVVREKASGRWTLPWAARGGEEESLRSAAQRAVVSAVGDGLDAWVMGEFPLSVWLHEYGEEDKAERQCLGEKRLFFRAEALDGRMRLDRELFSDYQWLSRDEILARGLLQNDGQGPSEGAPELPEAKEGLAPEDAKRLVAVPTLGGAVLAREAPDALAARLHEAMGFSGAEWVDRRRAKALADGHAQVPPTPFVGPGELDGEGDEEEQRAKIKAARRKRARFASMTLPRPPRFRSNIANRDSFLW